MKKVKLSITALALVLTVGVTMTANAKAKSTNDCSSVMGGPLDRDATKCVGISGFCCSTPTATYLAPYQP